MQIISLSVLFLVKYNQLYEFLKEIYFKIIAVPVTSLRFGLLNAKEISLLD